MALALQLQKLFRISPFLPTLCFILSSGNNTISSTHKISGEHHIFLICCLLEIFAVIHVNSSWQVKLDLRILAPEYISYVTLLFPTLFCGVEAGGTLLVLTCTENFSVKFRWWFLTDEQILAFLRGL